jgi:hypothetical protein
MPLTRVKAPPAYRRLPSAATANVYTGPLKDGANDQRGSPVSRSRAIRYERLLVPPRSP